MENLFKELASVDELRVCLAWDVYHIRKLNGKTSDGLGDVQSVFVGRYTSRERALEVKNALPEYGGLICERTCVVLGNCSLAVSIVDQGVVPFQR